MDNLNTLAKAYLDKNGITTKFFAEYIGTNYTTCLKWFTGERKLKQSQLKKVHEFLMGHFLTPVEDILKEE